MIPEEWMSRIGGEILLAGGKIRRDIGFGPEAGRNRIVGFAPTVKLNRRISAYFHSHPAPAVVVNAVHVVVCVGGSMLVTNHGMPCVREIAPTLVLVRQTDKDRAHRAADFGVGTIRARH